MILTTAVDAFVRQDRPDANYGSAAKLWLNGGAGSDTRYAYLFFSRPFPPGVTVLSATLRLYLADAWASSQTITAKRIVGSWSEGRIKWSNRPSVDGTNPGSVNVSALAAGAEVEIDVTNMLGDVSAGGAWYGIRLELDTDVNRSLASAEHPTAALRPVLEITWSEAPEAPTNLAPSGGRAVSDTKPLLTWDFIDRAGSTEQASSQVQVSTSADFTAPAYDSGKVANTLSEWDLAATAFGALADDAVRYWRVRVWDAADLVSEWSEAQEFTRKSHGTLTITNPDPSPANTVEETTPPLSWTFTGRTQEAFAAYLYRVNPTGGVTLLAKQDRVASTDTAWEVPAGILRTGDTYRFVLLVYDDLDRQGMAGDPAYVSASRDFTYVRSGTPAAVTALTATPDGAKVVLDFTRTTDPDYFAIRVDGVEVLDRIEPADVFVSGDDYSFDYWLAEPRVEHTYEVEAVVLDAGVLKHSDGNATATATTNPLGIWLADPVESLGVFIAGKEKASMAIGEVSGLFDVVGSRRPVRVTDAIHGYEGSFQGVILTEADRDAFLELYGRLTTLRLIIGDLNIPVELGEVSAIPSPIGADAGFDVSFTFVQVDEFDAVLEVAGG